MNTTVKDIREQVERDHPHKEVTEELSNAITYPSHPRRDRWQIEDGSKALEWDWDAVETVLSVHSYRYFTGNDRDSVRVIEYFVSYRRPDNSLVYVVLNDRVEYGSYASSFFEALGYKNLKDVEVFRVDNGNVAPELFDMIVDTTGRLRRDLMNHPDCPQRVKLLGTIVGGR